MTLLPGGTLDVPPLGFGCAYLVGGFNRPFATRVVAAALDAGYRHFDVAPSYGLGSAEGVLGNALRGRRHAVTITSKAGEPWSPPSPARFALRSAAMPLRARVRSLRRRSGPGTRPAILMRDQRSPTFDVQAVSRSLDDTLRRLRTDYLDIFLLHEAELVDISDELLAFLQSARQAGKVRAIGVGSERERIEPIAKALPDAFDVYQYSWDALDRRDPLIADDTFSVLHRAILFAADQMLAWRHSDPGRLARASAAADCDLADEGELARVLLGASISVNAGGLTLLGSRNPDRARAAAAVLHDPRYVIAGRALRTFITARPEPA